MTQYEKLVVSAYTGVLMTKIDDYQNFVEQTLGRPVMTVELGDRRIKEALKEKLQQEFLRLCKEEETIERPKMNPDVELYILIKKAFEKLPTEKMKREYDPMRFATYGIGTTVIQGVKEFAELRQFLSNHGIGASDDGFQECFFNVRQDWMRNHLQEGQVFNLNATVIDDDGFKGKVVAYNPEANMYKIEHELVNRSLPVAAVWFPPERLRLDIENTKSSLQLSTAGGIESLIETARAISEQGKGLVEGLSKFRDGYGLE